MGATLRSRAPGVWLPPLALLVLLVLGWEAWVRVFDTEAYVLPAPSRVWRAFLEIRGTLPGHLRVTMAESLLGLAIGAGAGVALAALVSGVPLARRVLYPLLVVSQTIPMIVLAPLLIIWFGFGMTPKVVVVALVAFFPVAVSTAEGLMNSDPELRGLVRAMGGNHWQLLTKVLIPGAVPAFFAGLKIAAAYAVTGAVIGEYVGANEGLGVLIKRAQASYRVDRVFVAVAVIAAASVALFLAVQLTARLAAPWLFVSREERP